MENFALLTKLFGISFTSGINLYATVAVVGLVLRYDLIKNLPIELEPLANEYVIGVAVFLYVCEFFADKIPAFDSLWDTIHTFIRPLAASGLALMAFGDAPLYMKLSAMLIAGSVALTSHTAKAGTRLVVNTSPEPFSNSIVSLLEDVGVFALLFLILAYPIPATIIISILLLLIIWQGPKLAGFIFFFLKALCLKVKSCIPSDTIQSIDSMPDKVNLAVQSLLDEDEMIKYVCHSTYKGLKSARGYTVITDKKVFIVYKKWFSVKFISFEPSEISYLKIKPHFLTDKIYFQYRGKRASVVLFKSSEEKLSGMQDALTSLGLDTVLETSKRVSVQPETA